MLTTLLKKLGTGTGIIAAIVLLFALGLVFASHVSADNTIGDLMDQKAMLKLRIEQTQTEYQKIGAEKQAAQEYCNIAVQKGNEMTQLAELNGARRKEIDAIDQKLSTLSNLPKSQ